MRACRRQSPRHEHLPVRTQIFSGRDAEELQKSAGVEGFRTFMNLHGGMEHGDDVAIGFAVAAT